MKKRIFQVLALVLALVMCAAVAVSVLAEEDGNPGTSGTTGTGSTYQPNKSGKVYFDKNLIMPGDATVPNVEFSFTLSANTTAAGKVVGGFTVYEGIFELKAEDSSEEDEAEAVADGETEDEVPVSDPTNGKGDYKVSYDGLHPTTKGTTGNSITSDPSQKYATESFGINFSRVDYTEPGMYRYKITEDNGDALGVTYTGTATTYYIDVYVKRAGDDIVIDDVIVSKDDKLDEDEEEPGTSEPSDSTDPSESSSGSSSSSDDNSSGGSSSGDDTSSGSGSSDDASSDTSSDTSSGSDKVNAGGGGEDNTEPGEGVPNPDDRVPNEGGDDDNNSGESSEGGESGESGESSEGGESGESSEGGESGDTSDPGTTPDDPTKENGGVNKGVSKADFNNVYAPLTLEITKTVNGDQGVRKDYFKFTVTLSGVKEGVYKIVGAENDSHSDNYLVVYKDSNGEGKATVYLKHNTGITILVPYNTDYEIVEDADTANAKEYKTSTETGAAGWGEEDWKAVTDEQAAANKTATGTVEDAAVTVAYVNYKDGTISTGILLAIAPFVVLMVVAVVGGVIVLKKKKED